MRSVVNTVCRAALLVALVSSTAVVTAASPAAADTRSELYITYYAEPELINAVGASYYCYGQPYSWGDVTPYRTYEENDFC